MMTLKELYQQADQFVAKHALGAQADYYRKECSVGNIDDISTELDTLKAKGRHLRIGIIGRVKAGKSSLLNALLFDGEDILPKAATPMTAALTVMTYSDNVHAELDFFSSDDIQTIKRQHDDFYHQLSAKIAQIQETQQRRRNKQPDQAPLSKQEAYDKAYRRAMRDMKEHPYLASYDQYRRIQDSGVQPHDLNAQRHIQADSIADLMHGKLNDFVGAGGRYMPFTKSVTLHIPHEGLRGLEIIDTPGINDPVQSRGRRTEEMLQQCDVVLIVSPAGQFLSQEDTQLMQRIATREGIQEIYIVASQTDNQLFGSEARSQHNPLQVLANVTATLSAHTRSVLSEKARQEGSAAAQVYHKAMAHDVICTSSAAYSLCQRFDQPQSWDANLSHVWQSLRQQYPDTFNETESAQYALNRLANIEHIRTITADVHQRKAAIMAERINKLESAKRQAMTDYLQALAKHIESNIQEIAHHDLATLKEQQKFLDERLGQTTRDINSTYHDLIKELDIKFTAALKQHLEQQIRRFEFGADGARGSAQESYEVYTGKSWWEFWKDEYETHTRNVETINASAIRRTIEEIRAETQDQLNDCAKEYKYNWRKKLHNNIIQALRGHGGANDDYINIRQTNDALSIVISQMPDTEFILSEGLPDELNKTGVLKSDDAARYLEQARDYISNFKRTMRNEINDYIQSMVNVFQRIDLADKLTARLSEELHKRIHEIENKEASLHNYRTMLTELNALQGAVHD